MFLSLHVSSNLMWARPLFINRLIHGRRIFFPIEGIELSLQEFVQFYPLFRTWKHDFQLADDFHVWLRFLDDVYRLIEEGFF